jgi:hypothetical protein
VAPAGLPSGKPEPIWAVPPTPGPFPYIDLTEINLPENPCLVFKSPRIHRVTKIVDSKFCILAKEIST